MGYILHLHSVSVAEIEERIRDGDKQYLDRCRQWARRWFDHGPGETAEDPLQGENRSIAEALEDIAAGRPKDAGSGAAYGYAFKALVNNCGGDPFDFGPFPRPAQYFSGLSAQLAELGVPKELTPEGFLFTGAPAFDLPYPSWGFPMIGHLPNADVARMGEHYAAAADQLGDPEDTRLVREFADFADFNASCDEYERQHGGKLRDLVAVCH
ncbi:DUF7691 family protein [Marinitenerispora sediminis]|uniref:DUF7691 domain-containing protein n=1 Tax=Marinitenerispora sediminis TaxID=1931232 RepID=A0A368SYS9_9ACTN|nr:hypothetical protein [Marinitenerispora sediminis]RCV48605.1 hypothetical protein DEF28_23050 [Marinitenerispora sediminis]RCV49613.1 hypothetical protein DEF24_25050 [Marinitenerispora sediminis]RCV50331.1 hypothetical protein DEF23_22205 [Marinitenerispora sediminis]